MPDIFELSKDPEFRALPVSERLKAFAELDPDFAKLPKAEQMRGVVELSGKESKFTTPAQEMQPYIEGMSGTEKFLTGVGKGMTDIYTGGKQRLSQAGEYLGVSSPETTQRITQQVEQNRAAFRPLAEQSTTAKVGEFVGQTAPTVVIPGGVAGGLLRRGATAAGAGALTGALQPTGEGESALNNAATGALMGGATSSTMSALGKGYNAIAGKTTIPTDIGAKYKIPTTLGEVTDSPFIQQTESLLEKVPVIGIGAFRKKQNEAAETAAKGFLAKYVIDPNHPEIMSANEEYVETLYKGIADKIGDTPQNINPKNVKSVANALLDRYPDIFKQFQDTKMERLLTDIVRGTKTNTVASKSSAFIGDELTMSVPARLTFDEAWTLRKGLGAMIGQARQRIKSGNATKEQLGQLRTLFHAVDSDMETWGSKISKPEVMQTFKAANEAYRNYVTKYDVIQRAYDKAAGTVGAGEMFSPKRFSTALKDIAYKDKTYKLFSPREIDEMTGLANILQTVKRAGQYMENPPTGARWAPAGIASMLVGGGYVAGIGATVKTMGMAATATLITKGLTTTQAGKRLALAASKVEPNSKHMQMVMKSLYNMMPKISAQQTIGGGEE